MSDSKDNIKISVIVPVYGVSAYIGKFVKSLFSQTMTDGVEFIFVDDATPDISIEIVEKELKCYPQLQKQVKIVRHKENHGLPAARNTGLVIAGGEYVIHFDSDDYLEPTILENLYFKAKQENLDIVYCDWNLVRGGSCLRIEEPSYNNICTALKGMLIGPMHYNVWNKLIRRSLFANHNINIVFPEGYSMGEDMTVIMVTACAESIAKVNDALYNYVKYDHQTITADYTDTHIASLKHNVERVCNFITRQFSGKYEKELAFMKLGIKSVFLVSGFKLRLFRAWKSTFPEANQYIGQNPRVLGRIAMLEWFATRNMFFFVGLYNILIVHLYNKLCHR